MTLSKRTLGGSSVEVTELGMGGAPLGAIGARLDSDQADEIVHTAHAAGIRYFDTAPLYGHGLSEKRVGHGLATLDRDSFALSTKVGRLLVPTGEGERHDGMRDQEPFSIQYNYSYDAVRQSFESSLKRLGLDRVDVLLCHDIDKWTHEDAQPGIFEAAKEGALPALMDLRKEGLVRAVGLGVNEWQVCSDVLDLFDVDCFLLAGRFTLLEQEPLESFLPKCLEHNASVIIGGPYNSGLLAQTERRFATYDYKPSPDSLWEKASAIREICEKHNVDMRAAALQYPLRHKAVASVIPGVRSLDEMKENLGLISVEIPDELWRDLDAAGLSAYIET